MTAQVHDHPARGRLDPIVMPSNAEMEQRLLGSLLVDIRGYEIVSEFLEPQHFYIPAHQRLYAAIQTLSAQGKTPSTAMLRPIAEADQDLANHGGAAYLADLVESVITTRNVAEYANAIVELCLRRDLIVFAEETKAEAGDINIEIPAGKLLEDAEAKLFALAEAGGSEQTTHSFARVLTQALDAAQSAYSRDGKLTGITTGLIDLDRRLGGLHPSDLIILAGATSMGKTALATGIAWRAAAAGVPVAYFSAEMSGAQIGHRILCAEAAIDNAKVRRGEVSEVEFKRLPAAAHRLAKLPVTIDDRPAPSLAHIRSTARRLKRRGGLGLIVVDYLQLMSTAGKRPENRVQEVSAFSRGLKAIAKELNIPVLALAQLSRAIDHREDKRPLLADLRESGSIEQDADVVLFVFREEYYVERDKPMQRKDESEDKFASRQSDWATRRQKCSNLAEIIISKNRQGPLANLTARYDGPTTSFSDLEAHYDPSREM